MAIQIPPPGTRGAGLPSLPPMLTRLVMATAVAAFRLVGRWVRIDGRPLLLLTTVGAKTGKRRHTLLMWFPDGESRWLVMGSSLGAAKNPAWLFNLARNPNRAAILVDGRTIPVRAETLQDAERDAAWARVVQQSDRFRVYQELTDRTIPVVRLTRR